VTDDFAHRIHAARADPTRVVLEGFHALKHAWRFSATIELAVTVDPALAAALAQELAPDLEPVLTRLLQPVAAERLTQLIGSLPATGVVAIARRPQADLASALRGMNGPAVLLDSPSHLGNVGAVVRVAAALGARAVLTTGPLDPWHPSALRSSAGLHFARPVLRIADLPEPCPPLLALDPKGEPLQTAAFPPGCVLAFGSERKGLGPSWRARASGMLAIPMQPRVSSLNLATSVAVTLYAWRLRNA
jgi:TrmH family RNA methyltransferase